MQGNFDVKLESGKQKHELSFTAFGYTFRHSSSGTTDLVFYPINYG